ncbi:MAG: thioredoxin-like domain-containing protein [Phycisphaerales bacterium]|jgi:thiol-disulfide isomerase/thioredoxin|nr:thioredoxin-like domain-containing protein [Phycisphaerales bacterium]
MRGITMTALALALSTAAAAQQKIKPPHIKPPNPEPLTVLDAFIDATGGAAAYKGLKGLYRSYQWTIGDDTGDSEVRARPGGAFAQDMTMRGSSWHESQGSDGMRTWQEDAAGTCWKVDPEVGLQLRMEQDPTAMLDLQSYTRAMTVTGQVEVAGRQCWRLVAVPTAGRPWYLFFDAETGLLNRLEFSRPDGDGGMLLVTHAYEDWKPAGPIKVPGTVREWSKAGHVTMTLKTAEAVAVPPEAVALPPCAVEAFAEPEPSSGSAERGAWHGRLIDMIGPTLVNADGTEMPSSMLADTEHVLLYFTAKWCGPCRRFTPSLVEFAKAHADSETFAIVVVSSDRKKDDMFKYMTDYGMNFPAVPYARRDSSGIKKAWGARGIPNLVWLGPDDSVTMGSYDQGRYVGPSKVLEAFKRRIGAE